MPDLSNGRIESLVEGTYYAKIRIKKLKTDYIERVFSTITMNKGRVLQMLNRVTNLMQCRE